MGNVSLTLREQPQGPGSALGLKPAARLLLWRLAAAGGGEWIGEIRPAPSAAVRKELAEMGLATSEARRPQGGGRSGTWIELTEAGWRWATEKMGEDSGAASAAGDTLTVMLRTLRQYLTFQRLTAEDVFRHKNQETEGVAVEELEEFADEEPMVLTPMIEVAIVRAYLQITEERSGVRVLLTHLRQCVELSRPELDAALRRLAAEDRIVLDTLEDDELSPEDREAALAGPHGELFHVVSMEG
jgi:hypothetical protein